MRVKWFTGPPPPSRLTRLARSITYRGWWLVWSEDSLQVAFVAEGAKDGIPAVQKGRKFRISEFMTDSEIIQTVFLAVKLAEEHEVRERFRYRDQAVYGPHLHIETLVKFCQDHPEDLRS